MHRELLILRHGKSDWSHPVSDFDRPLIERGVREAGRVGSWLESEGLLPDWVIASPAQRARQTAQIVCEHLGLPYTDIQWEDALYMADVEDLLAVIRHVPLTRRRVLLVGHNPGLEELISYLADETVEIPDDGKLLPTATVAGLYLKGKWREEGAETASLIFLQRGSKL